ncbi:MAG: hypothetical protein ABI461_18780 [Polyangiaceae bacterium]
MKLFFMAIFGSILMLGCAAPDEIVSAKVDSPTTTTSATQTLATDDWQSDVARKRKEQQGRQQIQAAEQAQNPAPPGS